MSDLLSGYFSLGADENKTKQPLAESEQGVVNNLKAELTPEISDEELIRLKKGWESSWEKYNKEVVAKQDENENYWKGKQYSKGMQGDVRNRPLTDNLIFESLETFLPIATAVKPDPVVESDNTPEGNALADKVAKMLVYLSDILCLKLKSKALVRNWAIYLLGAVKVGWNMKEKEIDINVIRTKRLILDPDGTVEGAEYTGQYVGEVKKEVASDLIERFPAQEEYIRAMVENKMGTSVQYVEWWTDKYVFWTCKDHVLAKYRNPHWNYSKKTRVVDEMGMERVEETAGSNHFSSPKMPFVFLSVFNIGLHPHDDVSLIGQNLALQDLINKRLKQIDRNADATNGGLVVSGEAFTKEQASQVSDTLRMGGTVWVPKGGATDKMVHRDAAVPLPSFVYESLVDYRNELRNIFGTRGSTAASLQKEETVRGKVIIKQSDGNRISLITEYMEQAIDGIFNWFVQLMYVYYDEEHTATVLGKERAKEYVTLKNSDLNHKLLVSVKEGSLIPKDPLAKRNEAVDLWSAGAIGPVELFDRLEFANPKESAKQLLIWEMVKGGQLPATVMFPDMPAPPMAGAPLPGGGASVPQAEPAVPAEESVLPPGLLPNLNG